MTFALKQVDNFLVTTSLTLLNLLILLADNVLFDSAKREEACNDTGKLNFLLGEPFDRGCVNEFELGVNEGDRKFPLPLDVSEILWHPVLTIGVASKVTSSRGGVATVLISVYLQ